MRLVLFVTRGASKKAPLRVGALHVDGVHVADVSAAVVDEGGAPLHSMRVFLESGAAGLATAARALGNAAYLRALEHVELRAPIYDPEKVLCVGMNYVDHCTEQGLPLPKEPVIFNKFASSIIANGEPIALPAEVSELDFEVELAVVIGKEARRVPVERALEYVAGYTVAHDVSARDWQLKKNSGQWLLGKACDTFAPLGPAIVTPDEVGDVGALRLRTLVNGKVMQDSSTKELVHGVAACIAWVSKLITLKPGDVILTGTPPGVGCFRKPTPFWLSVGDVVTVEIEKLGAITNAIVAESPDVAR